MKHRRRQTDSKITGPGHAVYQGDCAAVLPTLSERAARLVFADPPYNLQLKQDLYRPNQTKVDGVSDAWDKFSSTAAYDEFTAQWLSACRRVMTDDATIWVIGSYHNIFRVGKIMMDLGFWILNDVQWHKTNPMPNFRGVRFTNATETLIWAKKSETQKKYTFNHQVMRQLNGGKQMTSVWNLPLCVGAERLKGADGKKAHSTQKPEELLRRVILSASKEGDTVLDPFAGSGTTCAVAKKLKRNSIGIEKERRYVRLIKNRLARINPDEYDHWRLVEPAKASAHRVSMAQLIRDKWIKKNQVFYTKDKKHSAVVLADGRVKNGVGVGSIHQVGALLRQTDSCNGWMYWHYEGAKGALKPIDDYRKKYRAQHGL